MEKVLAKIIYDNNEFYLSGEFYDKIGMIGKKINGKILLRPEEVLYIVEKGWGYVEYNKKVIDKKDLIKIFGKNFSEKIYLTFKDLRDKGYYLDIEENYIILHEKGIRYKPKYLIYPIFIFENLKWENILDLLEISKNKNLKLVLAIIDEEFSIVYYELEKI